MNRKPVQQRQNGDRMLGDTQRSQQETLIIESEWLKDLGGHMAIWAGNLYNKDRMTMHDTRQHQQGTSTKNNDRKLEDTDPSGPFY